MGYCPDWQRQSMKKTGQSGPTTTPSRKDMGSLFHGTPAHQSKSEAKPLHLADGDTEATYKARGMEASRGENVGFFERLRMGNIDQPGSEAYNRFGAGRGRMENDIANEAAAMRAVDNAREQAARDDADFAAMDREIASGRSVTGNEPTGNGATEDRAPAPKPRRRAASRVSDSAVKTAPAKRSPEPPIKSVMTDRSNDQVEAARFRRMAPAPTPTFDPNALNFVGRDTPKPNAEDKRPTRSRSSIYGSAPGR